MIENISNTTGTSRRAEKPAIGTTLFVDPLMTGSSEAARRNSESHHARSKMADIKIGTSNISLVVLSAYPELSGAK